MIESPSTIDTRENLQKLIDIFPDIARSLIQKSQNLSLPQNQSFLENFDDVREHEYRWHQWGIFTHTKKFLEYFESEVPLFLSQWKQKDFIDSYFSQKIDGIPKKELFLFAILFHDLGKFTNRKIKEDGTFSFKHHEDASGKIIRENFFLTMLREQFSFTPEQIEYIARSAELHFKLGDVRTDAKKSKIGYSFAFVNSPEFDHIAQKLIQEYPDFSVEIGILFLADSLAKMEFRIGLGAQNDEEIDSFQEEMTNLCHQKNLPREFISMMKQLPISLFVTKKYLELCQK